MATHAALILRINCVKVIVKTPRRSSKKSPRNLAQPNSYADVLLQQGWEDDLWLSKAFSSWVNVLRTWRAGLVVADYAPLAIWASTVLEIPTLHVSSGFDAPSSDCPLFSDLITGAPTSSVIPRPDLSLLQLCMKQASSTAQLNSRQVIRCNMQCVLEHPLRLFDAIPETDIYGHRTQQTYAAFRVSVEPDKSIGQRPQFSTSDSDNTLKVFAYLRAPAILKAIFSIAHKLPVSMIVVCPDAAYDLDIPPRVNLYRHITNLHSVLNTCDVIVSYGSIGLASQAILAGKPHLIVPSDVEKLLLAKRIVSQGLGIALNPLNLSDTLAEGLSRVNSNLIKFKIRQARILSKASIQRFEDAFKMKLADLLT